MAERATDGLGERSAMGSGPGGYSQQPSGRWNAAVGWQERAGAKLEPGDLGGADRPADQPDQLAGREQVAAARSPPECLRDATGAEPPDAQMTVGAAARPEHAHDPAEQVGSATGVAACNGD